jgi:hypothetical protein
VRDRLISAAATLAAVLAAAGGFYLWGQREAEARLKPAVKAAETQTEVTEGAARALDRLTINVPIIREKADAAVETIRAAPGADDPLPAGLLDAWRRGMRDDAGGGAPDPGGGEPAG